jgi:flagellar biosynthesis chaperone FliJ
LKLHQLVKYSESLCEYYHIDRSVQELAEVRDHLSNMDRDLDPQYSQYVQHNLQTFNDAIIKIQHQHGTVQHFLSTIDQHIQNITHELCSEAYDSELRFAIMEHESRAARTLTIPQSARELILDRKSVV